MPERRLLPLARLDERIEARARAIQESHAFWPCQRGCSHCCRTLSQLPVLTEPEWLRVEHALAALPADARAVVLARVEEAPAQGPVVCAMLDRAKGECMVYAARPIVCRMHGFYTERDGGLHCDDVGNAVRAHGAEDAVVWGNGDGVQAELDRHGAARSLRAWLLERA
jgi:Fe-S-cluster containining protein